MKFKSWKDLSVREKIGQTAIMNISPGNSSGSYETYRKIMETYTIGGFTTGEVIKDDSKSYEELRKELEQYQEESSIPLLINSDLENGCGSMVKGLTEMPHLMALGAVDSEKLAYEYGKVTALEGLSAGINWALAPVADLNMNPLNGITNNRAMSDDPEKAIRLLQAVIKGMQDHDLAATIKHFPGDGVDYRNQHHVTTVNSLSMEEWWKNHGLVFQNLIDAGVYSIMIGHIAFPAYQRKTLNGRYLPATLSYELVTQLLKKEMGFKGVVVSDALMMGGYLGWYDRTQIDLECFKAGVDMLLWPDIQYFSKLEQSIETGEVPMERLDEAVERIWTLKEKLGLFKENNLGHQISKEEKEHGLQVSREVAERCVTLVRDRKGKLPLKKEEIKKVLVIGITPNDMAQHSFETQLKAELENRGMEVTVLRNTWYVKLAELEKENDLIIYAVQKSAHGGGATVDFGRAETVGLWGSMSSGVEKSIMVSFGSPYVANQYFESADICINVYSHVPDSINAAVKAIFGEIGFEGRSPVKI